MLQLQETTAANEVALFGAPQLREKGDDFSVVDANGKYMSHEAERNFLKAKYGRKSRG